MTLFVSIVVASMEVKLSVYESCRKSFRPNPSYRMLQYKL